MIDEVLKEIRAAEEKAALIKSEADEYSAKKMQSCDEACSAKLSQVESEIKTLKKTTKESIRLESDALYLEAMNSARKDAESLLASVDNKITHLAEKVTERIVNGNC